MVTQIKKEISAKQYDGVVIEGCTRIAQTNINDCKHIIVTTHSYLQTSQKTSKEVCALRLERGKTTLLHLSFSKDRRNNLQSKT